MVQCFDGLGALADKYRGFEFPALRVAHPSKPCYHQAESPFYLHILTSITPRGSDKCAALNGHNDV
jgi:hypothetical protein